MPISGCLPRETPLSHQAPPYDLAFENHDLNDCKQVCYEFHMLLAWEFDEANTKYLPWPSQRFMSTSERMMKFGDSAMMHAATPNPSTPMGSLFPRQISEFSESWLTMATSSSVPWEK